MVSGVSGSESVVRNRKLLLGIGFWVQGLRCFPWLGVNFFLKDGLRVEPSTLQILQNSANLPMVAKPFYGIISDSFYIFGQHRVPYIAIGGIHFPLHLFSLFCLLLYSNCPAFLLTYFCQYVVSGFVKIKNLEKTIIFHENLSNSSCIEPKM